MKKTEERLQSIAGEERNNEEELKKM